MLGQTVPSTDSSNREGLIADGGQPCMTDIQRQRGSRSKVFLRPWNRPCTWAHRRDTTVLSHADTCTQEQQAGTASSLVLSASAVGGEVERCDHTSTKRTRAVCHVMTIWLWHRSKILDNVFLWKTCGKASSKSQ